MKVVFSKLALAELDLILTEITKHSPGGARRVEARISAVIGRIAEHPHSAQRIAQRASIFRVPLMRYPYSIYYEIGLEAVIILRVRHNRRRSL